MPAAAQPRRPIIGYLSLTPIPDPPTRERQAFLEGLRERGYVPGKTLEIIYRSAENEIEFLDAMCKELIKQKVSLIATPGAIAARAASRATHTIPVVMLSVGDPVGIGLVSSLSRPGGNVTGVSFLSTELAAKRMQLLTEIVPVAKRVAAIWDSRNDNARIESEAVLAAARRLGLTVAPVGLGSDSELKPALAALAGRKPDALYLVFTAGIVSDHRSELAEFGIRERIPVVSGWSFLTEAGGLVSYAPDIPEMFRRAAYYVDRILKGTTPAELPVEQPTKVELIMNMKTAKALGIKIPQSVLVRADRVIE